MLRKSAIYFILLILSAPVQAQTAFYQHFEGKLGENLRIVLDLVASGEDLGGYYYYYFEEITGSDSLLHYGKSMPVTGKLFPGNHFEFSEFNPDIKGSTFKGELKNGTITGTWSDTAGKKQLPFEAAESYPEGTMPFRVDYIDDKTPLTDQANSPEASIFLRLLLPSGFNPASVADSVRSFIMNDFFDRAVPGQDHTQLLSQARDLYFKNYKASNLDIYTEGDASFNWVKIQEARIMHNEKGILSVEIYKYGFTGGAHGLSVSKFHVIDLEDGHKVTLAEIFREDYNNDLRDILNSAARKKYRLERNQSLVDAGFFSDFIDPGDNFYLTKDGMGFYYNQYEVAPFALGPVDIFIGYKELLRILRSDSKVYRLIKAK